MNITAIHCNGGLRDFLTVNTTVLHDLRLAESINGNCEVNTEELCI